MCQFDMRGFQLLFLFIFYNCQFVTASGYRVFRSSLDARFVVHADVRELFHESFITKTKLCCCYHAKLNCIFFSLKDVFV